MAVPKRKTSKKSIIKLGVVGVLSGQISSRSQLIDNIPNKKRGITNIFKYFIF